MRCRETRRGASAAYALVIMALVIGCSSHDNLASDGVGDAGDRSDAPESACVPGPTQCSNCIDDDGDGAIDGFDAQCTSALDRREDSFATGIPGDNSDAIKQDCYYDGNSGAGDDGCDLHVCCLLADDACPDADWDRASADCTVSQECVAACAPLTPPGCDCFGCCTVCDGASCFDILIHPKLSPNCDVDVLSDPQACLRCEKQRDCRQADCDPEQCIPCPGQSPDSLPSHCTDARCPGELASCRSSADCGDTQFCAGGCCIDQIE